MKSDSTALSAVTTALSRAVDHWPTPDPGDRALLAPLLDPFAAELGLNGATLVAIEELSRRAVSMIRDHEAALARAGHLETPEAAVRTLAVLARHAVPLDYPGAEPLILARADRLARGAAERRIDARSERELSRMSARYRHAQYYSGGAAILLGRYERGRDVRQPWCSGGPRALLALVGCAPSRNAWGADLEMHRWAAERADRRRPEKEASMPEGDAETLGAAVGTDLGSGDDADALEWIRLSCATLRGLVAARGSADDETLRAIVRELHDLDRRGPFVVRELVAALCKAFRKVVRCAIAEEPEGTGRRRLVLYLRFVFGVWPTLKELAEHEGRPSGSVQCDMFHARRLLKEIGG